MNQKDLIEQLNIYWKENKIFQKSLDQRSEKFQSVTYDGPPFASGTPHFGHGLTSAMKDTILRYKTMKGYKVNRDRGRDCHGLPVEKAVEQALGIDGKKDIEEKIGVENFIEKCRSYVSNTSDERRTFVDQIGRRADMDHAYYTMNLEFMQSVIRVFQNMYKQNLVYKGFNVQWMCPSCATTLSNSEVNEGYKDRQDPAITIKFNIQNIESEDTKQHETTDDGYIQVVDCAIKKDNKFFMLYHKRGQKYVFPGGKIDKGDSLEKTIKKELQEELGIEVTGFETRGSFKEIMPYGLFNLNIIDVEYTGEPQNLEPEKHTHSVWAEIIASDNALGFAINIDGTIIDDEHEITHQFYDLYIYQHNIAQQISELQDKQQAPVSVLAWTTTPWTLPSNMFLAVGKQIEYCMVFDKSTKEYYIVAQALLKSYYKSADEYLLVNTFKGDHLIGLKYQPLFPHINNSAIDQKYKDQFFKIIPGEFVSTEDGTGIVHIAPAFGMDDYNAVAEFLPRDDSKNWLFLPVNDYGEFTDEVPERKWTRVYDANKDIIQRLKEEKKLIGQKSYEHSYPHCRRCDTPLISKALTSRFIKEQELAKDTVPNAEKIWFVPEWVKKRFSDVLKSAPDWNLARNRYRGSPLPIWENINNPEDRIVCGTLEEIYQWTRTGSQNLTKHIVIRHGKTKNNETHTHDSYSTTHLNDEGKQQAKEISEYLDTVSQQDDRVLILTPLERTWETVAPFMETKFPDSIADIQKKYQDIQKIYQNLRDEKKIQTYIQDASTQKLFEINEKIYVDFRTTDLILPELQNEIFPSHLTISKTTNEKLTPEGESIDDVTARCTAYMTDINQKFATKTIITITHKDSVILIDKTFKDFDYLTKKYEYSPENGHIDIHYRDITNNKEIDLHKPYVDTYRFKKWDQEYRRITEVMDCRFESWSMPFGQAGYIGDTWSMTHDAWQKNPLSWILNLVSKKAKPFIYPADFIIEGLDQTRGRFRTMHVCGNAVMKKNSFNNVVINGLVLAEDGKKMSKKLKNYPDPKALFERYGSDAYRLYLLSSPWVKAEAVKFSEKGVDQIYKDFTASIMNAYKFFETYAKVDNRATDDTKIYFMRHGKSTGQEDEATLTDEAIQSMNQPEFIENVLRINPEIIYTSPLLRAKQTAEIVAKIIKDYRNKDIPIQEKEGFSGANTDSTITAHAEVLEQEKGKNILIISHENNFATLRTHLFNTKQTLHTGEAIKLPNSPITNELDRRILAELHNLGLQFEQEMNKYILDSSAKLVLWFIEKLNNRFIRRSRRRFRASGMDQDKSSAFTTLFEVLQNYMHICASFAPFVSEHIYLQLQKFIRENQPRKLSVHLEHLPLYSKKYVDKNLLEEIELVRKIISLGLFIRSKNKIAVKQPLSKMQITL